MRHVKDTTAQDRTGYNRTERLGRVARHRAAKEDSGRATNTARAEAAPGDGGQYQHSSGDLATAPRPEAY